MIETSIIGCQYMHGYLFVYLFFFFKRKKIGLPLKQYVTLHCKRFVCKISIIFSFLSSRSVFYFTQSITVLKVNHLCIPFGFIFG